MATVTELSGNGGGTVGAGPERGAHDINQEGSGAPSGSVTPSFSGAYYLNTANGALYRAHGTTNTDWIAQYETH
jgi:hypothetical protein